MTDATSFDELLAKHGPAPAASLDELVTRHGGPAEPVVSAEAEYTPIADQMIDQSPIGRVLDAFGHGLKEGWGSGKLGISDTTEKDLREFGVFNDYEKGQTGLVRAFNEAVIRPAAIAAESAYRGVGALFRGAQGAVAEAGAVVGAPQLGRDIAAIPEAFQGGGLGTPRPRVAPAELAKARDLGVIGGDEATWRGTKVRTAEEDAAAVKQWAEEYRSYHDEEPAPEPAPGVPAEAAPPAPVLDINAAARQVAPEIFREYDALGQRVETFRRWLGELAESRRQAAEAKAPHAEEIAGLEARLEDATPRLAKKYEARLETLREERAAAIEEATTGDTPDMARVRRDLQAADYRMRDLAPEVSQAYRDARETVPEEPAPAEPTQAEARPAETVAEPATATPAEAVQPAESAPAAPVMAGEPRPESAAAPVDIAADVEKKLVEAGRGSEEAKAAAAVVASHYEARAARLGKTAEQLYAEEPVNVRGAATGGRSGGASGKTVVKDGRRVVTLFGRADASTFIHETGHTWLEEMMADAAREDAPAGLKSDANAVLSWLRVNKAGDIKTRHHEQFARGFERYMMEGVAPSRGLAAVFAQFRDWLTRIYKRVEELRSPITDDIRSVFDRLIVTNPERQTIIAAEREGPGSLADRHEAAAESVAPENARTEAERLRAEADADLKARAPDEHADLAGGPGEGTGIGQDEGATPDRNGNAGQPDAGAPGGGAGRGEVGAGRGEAAAQGVGARAGAKPELAPYQRLPKEPERLVSFLRRIGGIKDTGGDIGAIVGGMRGRPGLINNKTGLSIDAAAERAREAGYLGHQAARADIDAALQGGEAGRNELLDAIAEDHAGRARYSLHDDESAADYRAAVAHNDQIDELASRYGISTRGKSAAAFWDEVAARVSADRAAEEARSQAEAHIQAIDEAKEAAVQWLERNGETAKTYDAKIEPRTLEDLENEYRQEEAARGPLAGEADAGRSSPAARREGEGEEGPGSRRGGPGAGSGGGAQAGGGERRPPPLSPHDRLPEPESRVVDKAGNIRLDNLGTPEDVNLAIREAAAANDDFITARRGVISDAQVLDLADALGMDPGQLSGRKLGQAFNAEEVVAARKLLIRSATDVRDAMAKAASGSDADVLAYAEVKARHQMIQEQVAGLTAEAGRALRAFRAIEGAKEAAEIGKFLEENTGKTLFQLRKEAQLGMKLETPQQVSRYMQEVRKPGLKDMVVEAWISALLSGPKTHVANILGNAIVAVWRPLETAAAAVFGKARSLVTGSQDRVFMNEAAAEVFGIVQGAREGVVAGWQAFKTEEPQFGSTRQVEQRQMRALPSVEVAGREIGGKQVRIPLRLLTAEDEFFKAIAYRGSINRQAYVQAAREGVAADRLPTRVAEIIASPTEEMIATAKSAAEYQTFQVPLGPTGRAVQMFANSHILAKLVIPFVRTPINLLKYASERTPLGIFSGEVRANLSGRNGAAARDTQVARIVLGSAIGVTAFSLAAQGLVTGGGPADPRKKSLLRADGWQPYSVRVGEMLYGLDRLDPFSIIMGLAADAHEIAAAAGSDHPEMEHIPAMIFASVVKNVTDRASLRGPAQLVQAVSDPERYGESYVRSLAGTVIPALSAQSAQALDPVQRETRTMLDTLKSRIPGQSQGLMPRRDVWGEPITREGALGPDLGSPIIESRLKNDPVNQALLRLGVYPGKLDRKIRGVELTDRQYDDFARVAGRMAKQRADAIVSMPGFSTLPEGPQREMLTGAITGARETARAIVMMQNPSIVRAATEAKIAAITGPKPKSVKQPEAAGAPSP